MNRKNFNYKFRRAWSWPASVENFLQSLLISPSLHVACGESKLGDVRLDLIMPSDVRGDMFKLPFRDNAFATVLIDPPWHLAYHLRPALAKELARVLRPEGRLIFNAPWRIGLKSLKLIEVWWADAPSWRNCPIFQIYKKIK